MGGATRWDEVRHRDGYPRTTDATSAAERQPYAAVRLGSRGACVQACVTRLRCGQPTGGPAARCHARSASEREQLEPGVAPTGVGTRVDAGRAGSRRGWSASRELARHELRLVGRAALRLGLLYMHARHYAPTLGRFLQPDPDGSEDNLYTYAANSPATELDPDGTCFILCIAVGVRPVRRPDGRHPERPVRDREDRPTRLLGHGRTLARRTTSRRRNTIRPAT